jgi:hypothetical protein
MLIEASQDRESWQTVEWQKYTQFPGRPLRPYDSYMSTDEQEKVYLASLTAKKISYEVIQ